MFYSFPREGLDFFIPNNQQEDHDYFLIRIYGNHLCFTLSIQYSWYITQSALQYIL